MELLSADGVPYHKSCFKCSHCKGTLKTRSPSKAAGRFSGTQEKCATCGKTAYPLEKVMVEGQSYHKSCFKCSHGGCPITPSNYAALEGILYCKHHLIKSASIKRASASVPEA
ncbi:hypothetical protein V6N12_069944 [Hibiscus sabdariffa]|uniref:LIM zinc-binding domain-containing protein n=1 Tax=Hibiscus sabdariffa TaxID=183260 RepID=A0ABR2FFJ7_9ROSI